MAEPLNRADRGRAQKESGVAPPTDNPRPQYRTIIATAVISVGLTALVMGFLPYLVGLFQIQTLTPMTRDIAELKTQMAVLKNSVENLEKFEPIGRLKTQATKLGIKDPQITSVDLKPHATFTVTIAPRDQRDSFVRMDYVFEEISKDTITVAVRGTIFERGKLWDEFGPYREKISLKTKTVTFKFTGKTLDGREIPLPAITFAILERDESNKNLTVATGISAQPTT